MLSEDELSSLAQAYAQERYGCGIGSGYTVLKAAELSDPPVAFFSVQFPAGEELTGDGGFFISISDGQVTGLGSGDWVRAWHEVRAANPETLPGPESGSSPELLRRIVLNRQSKGAVK